MQRIKVMDRINGGHRRIMVSNLSAEERAEKLAAAGISLEWKQLPGNEVEIAAVNGGEAPLFRALAGEFGGDQRRLLAYVINMAFAMHCMQ